MSSKIKDNMLYGWIKKFGGEPEIVAAQAFKSEDHLAVPGKCDGFICPQDRCWHTSDRMTKELVLQALRQAHGRQQPEDKVLHHSDRGNQYASQEYQKQLKVYSMIGGMSRKGNCYDNACLESFHSIIKKELIYLNKYKTRTEAKRSIFEYIQVLQ